MALHSSTTLCTITYKDVHLIIFLTVSLNAQICLESSLDIGVTHGVSGEAEAKQCHFIMALQDKKMIRYIFIFKHY